MERRFVSIFFPYLATDSFTIKSPELGKYPFVLRESSRGRMVVMAANREAVKNGISRGMVLADARAILPDLLVQDYPQGLVQSLLTELAEWCIRFSPVVAVDFPDGIFIDASGCSHLWGGDKPYVNEIQRRINSKGYHVSISMADTAAVAWGMTRYGKPEVVPPGRHRDALLRLPPEALRLDPETTLRLHQLGLHQISQFIDVQPASLRKRFGNELLMKVDLALGRQIEMLTPLQPPPVYEERLPCMDPIVTDVGIRIALEQLVTALCHRLMTKQKSLRKAILKGYRVDGITEQIEIGTNRPTHDVRHILKLFETSLSTVEPALGIELFTLEATIVEDHLPQQEKMWEDKGGLQDNRLSELLDRLASKMGSDTIHRYLPEESYWPERSIRKATTLEEPVTTTWRKDKSRPLHLLAKPDRIDVSAPIPDYPPMLFRWKNTVHKITRADGPERIEQEWWIQQGQHRDYYSVEDEDGMRYWIFRSGHYDDKAFQWYLHGFFA